MIGKSLLLNHSPSEWFSLYNKKGQAVCLSFLLLGEMCPCMACRPLLAAAFLLCRHPVFPYGTGAVSFPGKFPVPPSGNGAARFSASAHPGAGAYSQRSHCRQLAFLLCRHPVFPHGTGTASSPANFRCPGFQRAHRTTHIKRTDPSGVCPFCHIWDQSTMALTASMRSTTASRGTRAQELPSTTARQESPS